MELKILGSLHSLLFYATIVPAIGSSMTRQNSYELLICRVFYDNGNPYEIETTFNKIRELFSHKKKENNSIFIASLLQTQIA